MPLEVVSHEEIEREEFGSRRLGLHAVAEPRKEPKPIDERVLQVLGAIGAAVAIRVILALAVIGSFVLALLCVRHPDPAAIWVFGLYTVTVLGPLTWLAQRRT